eukprot:CAMPEP_0179005458 /NCGR_PEP_ID=MMETSP0795-20121207/13952_1 /TAXON_ID=88552 /ORGANISM="Amoebophrya sp., Strain Ameob2" /LENGTH=144 /DNA_ID=CAMNT_0020699995 /DNA_START=508 /DNA_END=939 /DNA_ORIENTATION=+
MPAGPSQQDAKRAGSLTFEMEIVDPMPVLAKLQDIRQESDASLVNLVDTCAQCFQRMRDLQVELQSKLILTNTPPEIWREQWDAAQQEMLNLHQLLFHPENDDPEPAAEADSPEARFPLGLHDPRVYAMGRMPAEALAPVLHRR